MTAPATDRPLRLLIRPGVDRTPRRHSWEGQEHGGMRWVQELNGHPGQCSPEHRHSTPEEAMACFRGDA